MLLLNSTNIIFKMNAFWNSLYLERPPYSTWCVTSNEKDGCSNQDVALFKSVLDVAIGDLDSTLKILYDEATVLSRLIYRMKNKFRNDKGFRSMAQLNKALTNCLNMFLTKEYQTLRSVIDIEEEMCILPSKQMLEYVLVRTQGCGKLMSRVEEIAQHSCHFLKARITLGHAWNVTLFALAIVSRISCCARAVLRGCCKWYNRLYVYLEQFKCVGLPWIPKHESLPKDLQSWLSLDCLNVETSCNTWQDTSLAQFSSEESDNIDVIASNNFKTDNLRLPQEDILNDDELENESKAITDINDIGEIVNRETFEESLPNTSQYAENSLTEKRKYIHVHLDAMPIEQRKNKKHKKNKEERYVQSEN